MKILMNREQMNKVATNAINASVPVGYGLSKYIDKIYTVEEVSEALNQRAGLHEDVQISHKGHINIDYYEGRMVKLFIQRFRGETKDEDVYTVYEHRAEPEYQSWGTKYPTYLDLVKSVIHDPVVVEDQWVQPEKEEQDD